MSSEFPSLPEAVRCGAGAVGLILGSGLGGVVGAMEGVVEIPYHTIPGLPISSVPGHTGKFVVGSVAGVRLLVAQGRVHLYEGRSAHEATALVRLMKEVGIRTLILTNASGAICSDFHVGRWMLIRDHLNLTHTSPLLGGPHFVDMSEIYSKRLASVWVGAACEMGIPLHEGVYAGLIGPQYETPAEIRMLRTLGADAVGMSTVLEAIQARALGMRVVGLSCLTNWAAGISSYELSHQEVLTAGQLAVDAFVRLLAAVLPDLPHEEPLS